MINKSFKKSGGFTLIELIIVMMIIALLAGLSLFAMQGARRQGRDSKRKADLEVIRSSLELFKADCNVYPATLPASGSQLTGTTCSPSNSNVYLQQVPDDPSSNQNYSYRRITTTTYTLCSTLEEPPATPNDTSNCNSCGTTNCSYKVVNP